MPAASQLLREVLRALVPKMPIDDGKDEHVKGCRPSLWRASCKELSLDCPPPCPRSAPPASLEKLVSAISDYQVESLQMIAELRKESEANAKEIRRVVEEGKKRYQETLARFARGEDMSATPAAG